MRDDSLSTAIALRDKLASSAHKLVLAESCTAGRVASALSEIPGISNYLCGSFVVYRCDSKTRWLGIPEAILDDPEHGPVSPLTTGMLAQGALQHTPEASLSVAVTGDIGPDAPPQTDGVCFVAMANRTSKQLFQAKISLHSAAPRSREDIDARVARLDEATHAVLSQVLQWLVTEEN